MGRGTLRRAIGAVKDKTSIGLAKVGSSNSISDLEIAIVKSTRHEEYPAEERHVREIINLTCYSRAFVNLCVSMLARRLNRTRNWIVALKTLMLIHRLLCEGDPAYEQEIFFATRRGTRMLNMSDFRDSSRSDAWDFSAFVRTFALYLDERLELKMQGKHLHGRVPPTDNGSNSNNVSEEEEEEEEQEPPPPPFVRETPLHEMTIEQIFTRAQHLQQLFERLLACRPTGEAKTNRVILVALYRVIRESFQLYYDIAELLAVLIDRFMELEIPDCVKVYEIFSRLSKQFDELHAFYNWSKSAGIARTSEYPEIDRITAKKLEVMDEFIREKSILAERRKGHNFNQEARKMLAAEKEPEQDDVMNIKALPPPEGFAAAAAKEQEEKEKEKEIEEEKPAPQVEGDLLNLHQNAITAHGDKLALVLFDGEPPVLPPTWEAFKDEPADWETALVVSGSNLSTRRASLGGGLDMLLLDGMYEHGIIAAAMATAPLSGSAGSVASGGGLLALPAPSASGSGQWGQFRDPFAASMGIAPPAYVQMSDMEKKQRLLTEEQVLWQQYARGGMQGQLGLSNSGYYGRGGFTSITD